MASATKLLHSKIGTSKTRLINPCTRRNIFKTERDSTNNSYDITAPEDRRKILMVSLGNKGHDVYLYPIILELQGSVFNCFKAAMTALAVQSPRPVALGRMLHDHAVTLLAKIIR